MKILGKVEKGYLLEATEDEIYEILGFNCRFSDGAPTGPHLGSNIPISALWGLIQGIRGADAQRQKALLAIEVLASLAKGVDGILGDYLKEARERATRYTKDGDKIIPKGPGE